MKFTSQSQSSLRETLFIVSVSVSHCEAVRKIEGIANSRWDTMTERSIVMTYTI
jgi:hypothetical protein